LKKIIIHGIVSDEVAKAVESADFKHIEFRIYDASQDKSYDIDKEKRAAWIQDVDRFTVPRLGMNLRG
jgi:hypothetical protein